MLGKNHKASTYLWSLTGFLKQPYRARQDPVDARQGPVDVRYEAVKQLAKIARDGFKTTDADTCCEIIVNIPDVLPNIVALLSADDVRVQYHAALILVYLSYGSGVGVNDNARCQKIIDAGAVPGLVGLLAENVDIRIQQCAVVALNNLTCVSVVHRQAIVDAGAVPGLVRLLAADDVNARRFAAQALAHLAHGSDVNVNARRQTIVDAGAVPGLVGLLAENVDIRIQQCAVVALNNLACGSGVHRQTIVDAGAVPSLVALLTAADFETRHHAVQALRNLTRGSGADVNVRCQEVVRADAVPHLVALQTADVYMEVRRLATLTLTQLAWPALVALLEMWVGSVTRDNAARIMADLAGGPGAETFCDAMIEDGALPLVSLLAEGVEAEMRCQAVRALANLTRGAGANVNARRQKLVGAGAVPGLVALLAANVDVETRRQAARALANLACGSDANARCQTIVAAGAVPDLVGLLTADDVETQHQAARVLTNLTCGSGADVSARRQIIVAADAIPNLVALLAGGENSSVRVQREVVRTLANLAYGSDADVRCQKIVEAVAVDLVGLLTADDVETRHWVACALANLTRGDGADAHANVNVRRQSIVLTRGAIPSLVALAGGESCSVETQCVAVQALTNLACGSDADALANWRRREILSTADAVPNLVALLAEEVDENLRFQAARALSNLVCVCPVHDADVYCQVIRTLADATSAERGCRAVMDAGVVSDLVELLTEDANAGIQLHAARLLANLASESGSFASLRRRDIVDAGALPHFVALLAKEGNSGLPLQAIRALLSFTSGLSPRANTCREAVVTAGAVPHLVKLLANEGLRCQAAKALNHLACGSDDNAHARIQGIVTACESSDEMKAIFPLKPPFYSSELCMNAWILWCGSDGERKAFLHREVGIEALDLAGYALSFHSVGAASGSGAKPGDGCTLQ